MDNSKPQRFDKKWYKTMEYKLKSELIEIVKELLCKEQKISSVQNRALRLFFKQMSEQFQREGITISKEIGNMAFEVNITETVFLEEYWRPIQKTLYGTTSTTQLTTKKINGILDVLILAFAQSGIDVVFPSQWELYLKQLGDKGLIYEK